VHRNRHKQNGTVEAIDIGRRMGAIMLNRLQVRNSPLVTKQIRLPQGSLDRRMLYQLGMDIESVFYKTQINSYKPALLYLTLDGSGSMYGAKWKNTCAVAVALAYVGSKMSNIDTVISLRGGTRQPIVSVIFDSRKDNFASFISTFSYLSAGGNTPEGLCYAATLDLITKSAGNYEVYFINFSDGSPNFCSNEVMYQGRVATQHTAKMVSILKDHKVNVLSYFIEEDVYYGINRKEFKLMYGDTAEFINVARVGEVIRTLNKALVQRKS
jgi:hypothetical protein